MEHIELTCPNCGRTLAESELYCYFCEMDLSKLVTKRTNKKENPRKNY